MRALKYITIVFSIVFHSGLAFFPAQVSSKTCSISRSQIHAFYSTLEGAWKIRLAWSESHPDCVIQLEEEVSRQLFFRNVETQPCKSLLDTAISKSLHCLLSLSQ